MIMNNVYFGNEGMTSTSANYYANIAKELVQAANERLNNIKLFNTSIAVIGSSDKQIMSQGNTDLGFIDLDLQEVASMNSFCAWVREAIKEKERQQENVDEMTLEEWVELQGIEMPVQPKYPRDPKLINDNDVINSWDINKRNKYLRLEAFAATYGKYIHPNGAYSNARKEAHLAVNKPITKDGTGRDTVLYYNEPSVSIQDVDQVFLQLQDKYRGYEKELNQMKAEIKETANELNRQAYAQLAVDVDNWKVLNKEYETARAELRSDFSVWQTDETERIAKLKIVIPDSLKATFKIIKEVDASN